MKRILLATAAAGLIATSMTPSAHAGLMVTQNDLAMDLANTIIGSGITITNAVISGNGNAFGTFTGGGSVGGGFFDEGIILSSGNVIDAESPNNLGHTSTGFGGAGDSDLESLLASGSKTHDAAVLTIDFESNTGDLFFNYIFASEEYNEFANSAFNDVFGFFLNGVNIALIPGTSDPVSINTVNGGNPYGTNAQNPELFNNNDLKDGGPFFHIEYDGFTDVFTAEAMGLNAGTHTLKVAVADTADGIYDSAVFIEAGTFSGTVADANTQVPEPATIAILGAGLAGMGVAARRRRRA